MIVVVSKVIKEEVAVDAAAIVTVRVSVPPAMLNRKVAPRLTVVLMVLVPALVIVGAALTTIFTTVTPVAFNESVAVIVS